MDISVFAFKLFIYSPIAVVQQNYLSLINPMIFQTSSFLTHIPQILAKIWTFFWKEFIYRNMKDRKDDYTTKFFLQ